MLLVAALLLLSAGAAVGLRNWLHPPLHLQAAKLLPEPVDIQDQGYLVRVAGDTPIYFDKNVSHWVMLYFGYTTSPDTPLVLQALGQMLKQFDGVDSQYKPMVIFVNLDPSQNKSDELEKFAQRFHPDMHGVTAHNDELARLTGFFGKQDWATNSSHIFILDPQMRYIGSLAPPHRADVLYTDMEQLTHQLWRYHVQR